MDLLQYKGFDIDWMLDWITWTPNFPWNASHYGRWLGNHKNLPRVLCLSYTSCCWDWSHVLKTSPIAKQMLFCFIANALVTPLRNIPRLQRKHFIGEPSGEGIREVLLCRWPVLTLLQRQSWFFFTCQSWYIHPPSITSRLLPKTRTSPTIQQTKARRENASIGFWKHQMSIRNSNAPVEEQASNLENELFSWFIWNTF